MILLTHQVKCERLHFDRFFKPFNEQKIFIFIFLEIYLYFVFFDAAVTNIPTKLKSNTAWCTSRNNAEAPESSN